MNILDDMPDVPTCPHCGHAGLGLQWAFPDPIGSQRFGDRVQCACLACGTHGEPARSYEDAIKAWLAKHIEVAA
jgi:hypothetical protein